jgi:transcriptional regulator with XRE-family HTH domain
MCKQFLVAFKMLYMDQKVFPRLKSRRKTFFREWRKYRRMTLERAAEAAHMTAGNLSAMERGTQGYTQAGLEALAVAYSCEPAHLLMVNPTLDDAMWSIWEKAGEGERKIISEVARTILKSTGT